MTPITVTIMTNRRGNHTTETENQPTEVGMKACGLSVATSTTVTTTVTAFAAKTEFETIIVNEIGIEAAIGSINGMIFVLVIAELLIRSDHVSEAQATLMNLQKEELATKTEQTLHVQLPHHLNRYASRGALRLEEK